MNKTLIIVLAICLVSVHAMVRRDAPVENKDDTLAKIQDQLKTMLETAQKSLQETFEPEKIKKQLNDLIDSANKGIQGLQNPEKKP